MLLEEALAGMEQAVGENHPWTLGCAINASALRNLVGDPRGRGGADGLRHHPRMESWAGPTR